MNLLKWFKKLFRIAPKNSYLYVFEYDDGKPIMVRKYYKKDKECQDLFGQKKSLSKKP